MYARACRAPLWQAAVKGSPNSAAIYEGYPSTVDWRTGGVFRRLRKTDPEAKFTFWHRPESRDLGRQISGDHLPSNSDGDAANSGRVGSTSTQGDTP